MGLRKSAFLCLVGMAAGADAAVEQVNTGIEFVTTDRVFTPMPFIPNMMKFAVEYMTDNEATGLNRFEFYNSYMTHARMFTLDKRALQEFQDKGVKCNAMNRKNLDVQELAICGRALAASYVEGHNTFPQRFGFRSDVVEILPEKKDGVFFFSINGSNVLLRNASDFDIKEEKRYELEVNVSPKGDYDLREVDAQFDQEAYIVDARLIK